MVLNKINVANSQVLQELKEATLTLDDYKYNYYDLLDFEAAIVCLIQTFKLSCELINPTLFEPKI